MTYRTIADSEIDPASPLTNALLTALRDNLGGAFAGESPFILDRAAIGAASSGYDASWVYTTSVTGLGFFEPEDITIAAGQTLTLPPVAICRVNGDVVIGAGSTLQVDTITASEKLLAGLLDQINGNNGGAAGSAVGGVGQPITGTRWFWNRMRGLCGGLGGAAAASGNAEGGGVMILIIDGDLTIGAGGKIKANGAAGAWTGAVSGGGAGAGTIIIVCTGTISGGTFEAIGGDGWDLSHGPGGGSGGGGYIALVASAYGTAPTFNVAAGTITLAGAGSTGAGGASVGSGGDGSVGGGGIAAGTAGVSEQITLTEPQIRSLLLRSY